MARCVSSKKKLISRLEKPVVIPDRLRGFENHYKIKLKRSGYRLVYEVDHHQITVWVITIGKREKSEVYRLAENRSRS
jgi:mRNA interferase RelE/StbE